MLRTSGREARSRLAGLGPQLVLVPWEKVMSSIPSKRDSNPVSYKSSLGPMRDLS